MVESCTDLVGMAKSGDIKAFDELVALHQKRVYELAYRMLGNAEDAEDVQQETFVRAWRNLRRFRQDSAFPTWLHRITVNLCISWKRRTDLSYTDEFQHTGPSPVECLERTEAVVTLRKILAVMPAHYKVLIVLRDLEERPFEEIAQIIGCSVESARTRLCRARNLLRDKMRPYLAEEDL